MVRHAQHYRNLTQPSTTVTLSPISCTESRVQGRCSNNMGLSRPWTWWQKPLKQFLYAPPVLTRIDGRGCDDAFSKGTKRPPSLDLIISSPRPSMNVFWLLVALSAVSRKEPPPYLQAQPFISGVWMRLSRTFTKQHRDLLPRMASRHVFPALPPHLEIQSENLAI